MRQRFVAIFFLILTVMAGCAPVSRPAAETRTRNSDRKLSAALKSLYLGDGALIGVTEGGKVHRWKIRGDVDGTDLSSPEEIATYNSVLYSSSYNASQNQLALGFNGKIRILPMQEPQKAWDLVDLKGRFNALDFSPDGKSLLISRTDNKIYRWKFLNKRENTSWRKQRTQFERYIGHGSIVSAVSFHPVGRLFVSSDWDGGLFVWETYDADEFSGNYDRNPFFSRFYTDSSNRLGSVRGATIENLDLSPDGKRIAVGFASGLIEFWIVRGLKLKHELRFHESTIIDMDFTGRSSQGVSLSRDGRLAHWGFSLEHKGAESREKLKLLATGKFPGARCLVTAEGGFFLGFEDGHVEFVSLSSLEEYRAVKGLRG